MLLHASKIYKIINSFIKNPIYLTLTMDDSLKNSYVSRTASRTNSLLGSFKMADSVLGSGKNRKIKNLQIKGISLIDKDLYRKQEECQVCFLTFGRINRQHHCRVCANAVCSDCSASYINKQRACDICVYKHSNEGGDKQLIKGKILQELKGIAILYVQNKQKVQDQLKTVNEDAADQQTLNTYIDNANTRMAELQAKIDVMKEQRERVEKEIEEIQGKN